MGRKKCSSLASAANVKAYKEEHSANRYKASHNVHMTGKENIPVSMIHTFFQLMVRLTFIQISVVTNFISFLLYNTSRARDTRALPRFSYLTSL